jgi:hypothetical protein
MSVRAKEKLQAWAAGMVLTFFGVFFVLAIAAFVIAYLTPTMGTGAYALVFVVAAAVSVAIGFVLRWLARG